MKRSTKIGLIGFLSIGALGTWAPKIFRLVKGPDEEAPRASMPAEEALPTNYESQPGPFESSSQPAAGELETAGSRTPSGSLDSAPAPSPILSTSKGETDAPDAIAWLAGIDPDATRNFGTPGRNSFLRGMTSDSLRSGSSGSGASRSGSAGSEPIDAAIGSLLDQSPLLGILHGPGDSLVILGDWLVREGESVPGTHLILARVDRRRIELMQDGEQRTVLLPPVRGEGTSSPLDSQLQQEFTEDSSAGGQEQDEGGGA